MQKDANGIAGHIAGKGRRGLSIKWRRNIGRFLIILSVIQLVLEFVFFYVPLVPVSQRSSSFVVTVPWGYSVDVDSTFAIVGQPAATGTIVVTNMATHAQWNWSYTISLNDTNYIQFITTIQASTVFFLPPGSYNITDVQTSEQITNFSVYAMGLCDFGAMAGWNVFVAILMFILLLSTGASVSERAKRDEIRSWRKVNHLDCPNCGVPNPLTARKCWNCKQIFK